MQLDVCTPPGIGRNDAVEALDLTTAWAKKARAHWKAGPDEYRGSLFGIVQGNFFQDLRKRSAEQLAELDLPGYAIGGLSVGEEPEVFRDFLGFTAPLLPDEKPKYVMGIGTPDYMLEAMEAGIDIFDCVYPTRVARNGTCFTRDGMLNLKNARFKEDTRPIEAGCPCPACSRYSRGYLRHLFVAREILGPMLATHHNLQFLSTMMDESRQAIAEGRFSDHKRSFLDRFRRAS